MRPGWDADNRTAAEHYILIRLLRHDDGLRGVAHVVSGYYWPLGYYLAKKTEIYQTLSGRKTSAASLVQLEWGTIAWSDAFDANTNKQISLEPGDDCGCP
jgi:hypothetical protein